jgi:hypothetical protein
MKRASLLLNLAFILLLLVVGGGTYVAAQKSSKPVSLGMIALLAAPQNYDGKEVKTWGFLHIGRMPEEDSLWLRKEDGDFSLFKNSFALDLSLKQRQEFNCVNHTYVLITGTLRSEGPDTSSMDSGRIEEITRLTGWSPYRSSPCETKQ